MKKILLVIATTLFITVTNAQFTFSVSPGLGLNTAHFGYRVNSKIVPYVGLQHLNINIKMEQSRDKYDYDLHKVYNDVDKYNFKTNLYIPNIGVKYFAIQQNKLQAYISANISKPILTGKIEIGDDNLSNEIENDFKNTIKNISFLGGELGFGVEYFFDDNFSLGGEFGIRHLNMKLKGERDGEFYNPDTNSYQQTKIEEEYKINTSPTFSKISLNFYFNKKSK